MAGPKKRYADTAAYRLSLNDDQLRQLGSIFAVWGQIDFQIVAVIATILNIMPKPAIQLLDTVTSGGLVGQLRRILPDVKDIRLRREITEFCERMGPLITKRNHITHGIWGWMLSADQKTVMPACQYHRDNERPVTFAELSALLRQVQAESRAITSILSKCRGSSLPADSADSANFLFGALSGVPPADWLLSSPLTPGFEHSAC